MSDFGKFVEIRDMEGDDVLWAAVSVLENRKINEASEAELGFYEAVGNRSLKRLTYSIKKIKEERAGREPNE